jgi:hypothetical protein
MVWKKVESLRYSLPQSVRIDFILIKIDAQQEFEIGEKQSKHQIWQQVDNTKYILCAYQQR